MGKGAETETPFASGESEAGPEETDRLLEELARRLARLDEKTGTFLEGRIFRSMERELHERLGVRQVRLRSWARRPGWVRSHEVDALASSVEAVYVIGIKTRLREHALQDLMRQLSDFPPFYPEHHGKRLYGILAAVDVPADLRQKVLREGIYLAQISGETFALQVPEDFTPRTFQESSPDA